MSVVLDPILFEAARDALGIYPRSYPGPDGQRVDRTAYQDGWNAALLAVLDHADQIGRWYGMLTEIQRTALLELLRDETAFLSVRDDQIICYLIMNDTFGYAEANAEAVPLDALVTVQYLWQHYSWDGLIAWAALQSGDVPIRERLTEQYHAARAVLEASAVPHHREMLAVDMERRATDRPLGKSKV